MNLNIYKVKCKNAKRKELNSPKRDRKLETWSSVS
jgi:hypothetical protein